MERAGAVEHSGACAGFEHCGIVVARLGIWVVFPVYKIVIARVWFWWWTCINVVSVQKGLGKTPVWRSRRAIAGCFVSYRYWFLAYTGHEFLFVCIIFFRKERKERKREGVAVTRTVRYCKLVHWNRRLVCIRRPGVQRADGALGERRKDAYLKPSLNLKQTKSVPF